MSATTRIKNFGLVVAGLAVIAGVTAIGVGVLFGAAELSLWILEWTPLPFLIALAACVFLFLPLAFFRPTRSFSAIGFSLASVVFGVVLWFFGMAYAYTVWGLLSVIIGLAFFGVGVVPVAMLAALLHGDWSNLGAFVLMIILTYGCRGLGAWLAEKAQESVSGRF